MLETIGALFVFSWLWTIIFLLILICLIFAVENEVFDLTLIIIFVVGCVALYKYDVNIIQFISNHLLDILMYSVSYIIIGLLWSFFKYDRLCAEMSALSQKDNYLKPTFDRSKRKICNWIIGWPFSVIGYFTSTFLWNVVNWIVTMFGDIYNQILERHYKK